LRNDDRGVWYVNEPALSDAERDDADQRSDDRIAA